MKKNFLILIVCTYSSLINFCHAQNPQLVGMTYGGGAHSCGTIFKMNGDGSGFQTVYSFDTLTGMNPYGSLLQAGNGMLYGMTFAGGAHYYGTVFRFDPVSYDYTDLYDFNFTNGGSPYGSLIQAIDGKLYGMTSGGGTKNDGVIFSFDPVSNTYSKLFDFVDSLGAIPKGNLMQASDGKLYGMTSSGGVNFTGVLFSFDPVNNIYIKKVGFYTSNGTFPFGSPVEAGDGKLYGTARNGGAYSAGVLFRFNDVDNSYSKLLDFAGGSQQSPSAGLTLANGKFYGMTLQGGANNFGSVYSFDSVGNIYTVVQDFDSTNGSSPQFNTLMPASNGKLYGMTDLGGANNTGVLFNFDPQSNTYTKLFDFIGANGKNPKGALIELQITTGIVNKENENAVSVYPNPAEEKLRIKNGKLRIVGIDIYNVMGKKIQSEQQETKNEKQETVLDFSSLAAGVYFVQIKSESGMVVQRFVKE